MNLFQRARAQLNLSPGERALLKLVEGFVVAGLVAALPVVAQLLAQQTINWGDVARIAGGTFAVAFLLAVAKFYKAQGDVPLAEEISLVAGKLADRAGISDVKTTITTPPVPSIASVSEVIGAPLITITKPSASPPAPSTAGGTPSTAVAAPPAPAPTRS